MLPLPDILLFGTTSQERHIEKQYLSLQVLGSPPKTFLLNILLAVSVLLFAYEQSILSTWQGQPLPVLTGIMIEVLFHSSVILLVLASQSTRVLSVVLSLIGTCIINAVLNALCQSTIVYSDLFRNHWGNFGFWLCCGIAFYRLPAVWASLIALISLILLGETNGVNHFLTADEFARNIPLLTALAGEVAFCALGWLQRSRALLFLKLQEVQAQLRLQILHTEELATTRERTRIARDIHDVLAHSLTVLSIQVQAARQLTHTDPDQLALKLEEMAVLLRESMVESRQVISLFREMPGTPDDTLGACLQANLKRFEERTSIACFFEEKGTSQQVSDEYKKTLLSILQEALTNAHRHGEAQKIWTTLSWQEKSVTLQVRNNGRVQDTRVFALNALSGHHGLRGMRERVEALGGVFRVDVLPEENFLVVLALPLPQLSSQELLMIRHLPEHRSYSEKHSAIKRLFSLVLLRRK